MPQFSIVNGNRDKLLQFAICDSGYDVMSSLPVSSTVATISVLALCLISCRGGSPKRGPDASKNAPSNAKSEPPSDEIYQSKVVSVGSGGGLKMFYDNRMYPQAVAIGSSVHIVWRGQDGFPYLATYDLDDRTVSKAKMLLDGSLDTIKPKKYRKDHHYAPVIWSDQEDYLHVLFGCHKSAGIHLVSKKPRSTQVQDWVRSQTFSESVSYPKIHRIFDDKTLVYFRESGHLGRWQYRISDDGGRTWPRPPRTSTVRVRCPSSVLRTQPIRNRTWASRKWTTSSIPSRSCGWPCQCRSSPSWAAAPKSISRPSSVLSLGGGEPLKPS